MAHTHLQLRGNSSWKMPRSFTSSGLSTKMGTHSHLSKATSSDCFTEKDIEVATKGWRSCKGGLAEKQPFMKRHLLVNLWLLMVVIPSVP